MIKSLEGIRGIAALVVALYHLEIGRDHFSFIRHGYLFVDLFFVLSGFVMYASYGSSIASVADLRSFLIRRIGRLFPLLLFSTVFFVLVANAIVLAKRAALSAGHAEMLHTPSQIDFLMPTIAETIATLTLTHGMGVFDRLILNTPGWSISVEFYTYVLFVLLCLAFAQRGRMVVFAVLSIVGLAVSIWASITVHDCLAQKGCLSLTYDFGFPRAVHAFFLGVLIVWMHRRTRRDFSMLQLPALGALVCALALVDVYPAVAFGFPLLFAVLIVSICNDSGPAAKLLTSRASQVLGLRSYSIYLMHMPLLLLFTNVVKRVEGTAMNVAVLLLYLVVLVVISGWTYRFIEDPFRTWFNRLARQVSQPSGGLQIGKLPKAPAISTDGPEQT